ncbi:unnamed protein product [marine sediment metagenome]|uniref:Uncharacterized protein n=1 Tax=marine sediment metagenome TaxID=412755 RepID=X1U5U2_9ZZZZ
MGRKKRSEEASDLAPVPGAPGAVSRGRRTAVGKEYRQVTCPVCGRAGGLAFWPYTQHFDPDKPFGVIQEVGLGRGRSFGVIGQLEPADEPETFELVKGRLLQAVREWRDKGWINENEF